MNPRLTLERVQSLIQTVEYSYVNAWSRNDFVDIARALHSLAESERRIKEMREFLDSAPIADDIYERFNAMFPVIDADKG